MVRRTATVKNANGIHCRPSAVIIKEAEAFPGTIAVTAPDGSQSDLHSIIGLLAMGLETGAMVQIAVDGPGEEAFADKLVELFERHFDFPPRGDE